MDMVEMDSMEDFLVPNLEEIADNPLIKDSFIGVTDPVLKWPLGVEFVEADESVSSSDVSYYPSSIQLHQQQHQSQFEQFSHQSSISRQRQDSFNLGHLLTSSPIDVPQHKQTFSIELNQQHAEAVERIPTSISTFDSWLEDKTDLTRLGGWLTESSVVDETFPEETALNTTMDFVAKDQILQEIVRECEEIERRSSPDESSPSTIGSSPATSSPSVSVCSSPFIKNWTAKPLPQIKRQDVCLGSIERKGVKVRSKVIQKEKKKAQNREAATRYREKKRRERDGTREELFILDDRNKELKTMVEDFEYEIHYLKNLMREIGLEK